MLPSPCAPSTLIANRIGTAAISWNSSTANVVRPRERTEAVPTDQHDDEDEANHRAHLEAAHQRHDNARRRQNNEGFLECAKSNFGRHALIVSARPP